jgi:hypothetical protein
MRKNEVLMTISLSKTAVQSQASQVYGQNWGGLGEAGKLQNDSVFSTLSQEAKDSIKQTINGQLWCNIDLIAQNLNNSGISAVSGKTDDASYLEITNSDGSKSRIWDIGGDSGIGTQDIDFNNALSSFKNEVSGGTQQSAQDIAAIQAKAKAEAEARAKAEAEAKARAEAEAKAKEEAEKAKRLAEEQQARMLEVTMANKKLDIANRKSSMTEISDQQLSNVIESLLISNGYTDEQVKSEGYAENLKKYADSLVPSYRVS